MRTVLTMWLNQISHQVPRFSSKTSKSCPCNRRICFVWWSLCDSTIKMLASWNELFCWAYLTSGPSFSLNEICLVQKIACKQTDFKVYTWTWSWNSRLYYQSSKLVCSCSCLYSMQLVARMCWFSDSESCKRRPRDHLWTKTWWRRHHRIKCKKTISPICDPFKCSHR